MRHSETYELGGEPQHKKLRGLYSFQRYELLFSIKRRSMFVILVDSDCNQECLDFFIFGTLLHIPAHLTGKKCIDFI